MKHTMRALLVLAATAAAAAAMAGSAAGVTPDQLMSAGWACRQPGGDPTRFVCAPPGKGLPPLRNDPAFADRAASYNLLTFSFATGEFIGISHLLRPDVYLHGTPPCPTQPNDLYVYIPGLDLYACFRPK